MPLPTVIVSAPEPPKITLLPSPVVMMSSPPSVWLVVSMYVSTLVATVLLTGSLVNVASPSSPTMTLPADAPSTVIVSAPVPPKITLLPPVTVMVSLPPMPGSCVVIVRIWPGRAEGRLAVVADDGVVGAAERNDVGADAADDDVVAGAARRAVRTADGVVAADAERTVEREDRWSGCRWCSRPRRRRR